LKWSITMITIDNLLWLFNIDKHFTRKNAKIHPCVTHPVAPPTLMEISSPVGKVPNNFNPFWKIDFVFIPI